MLKKILGYGVVGVLAVALVAGMVYILVRPAEVQAGQGPLGGQGQGRGAAVESGTGNRGSGAAGSGGNAYGRQAGDQDCEPLGDGGQGYRGGQGSGVGGGRGSAAGVGSGGGRGQAEVAGDGVGLENPAGTWVAVTGTVVAFDDHLIVRTTEGDVEVGTGPEWYWEESGFVLNAGDEVELHGFYEGDEFELGWIKNVTTDETLDLRDETGRPLWAGRGRWGQ